MTAQPGETCAAPSWMAVARLPVPLGPGIAAGITVALDLATVLSAYSTAAVLATTLLCALLGFVAYFVQEARASQTRTELLLAQLEDAREEQLAAAAVTERGRIASELHDVLAHSLSGAEIQLQGAAPPSVARAISSRTASPMRAGQSVLFAATSCPASRSSDP